jgi:hypothetical protein
MIRLQLLCGAVLLFGGLIPVHGEQRSALQLVQTIPLINSIPGIKDAQDALFLGGDFNKLYVSSLDGTLRIFQGETFRLVQALKLEPDPNRLHYDGELNRIYVSVGRWYGTPAASPGWVYVYQQRDADHYESISKVKTRPGSGTVASQAIGAQEAAVLVFKPVF